MEQVGSVCAEECGGEMFPVSQQRERVYFSPTQTSRGFLDLACACGGGCDICMGVFWWSPLAGTARDLTTDAEAVSTCTAISHIVSLPRDVSRQVVYVSGATAAAVTKAGQFRSTSCHICPPPAASCQLRENVARTGTNAVNIAQSRPHWPADAA